jgi:predicted nucleic acid-binding protein
MIITVDANILFSALITPANKLARIISLPSLPIQLVSGYYLIEELVKHHDKIVRFSKKPEQIVLDLKQSYLKNIQLYDETLIDERFWREAENLTNGVDNFDVSYVALTLQTGGLLWTGDKKLSQHLKIMGFDRVLDTAELSDLLFTG